MTDTYLLNNWQKLTIDYDDYPYEDLREFDYLYENLKLDFRENRSYNLPKDLYINWTDFDYWEENLEEKLENYYWCFIDCYIHWNYCFSLENEWINCRRDTAKKCWVIAIKKSDFEKLEFDWDYVKYFRNFVHTYNQRFNWEIYRYTLEKPHEYKDEYWAKIIQRDFEDGCWWFYNVQDILNEFKEFEPKEI